MCILYDKLYATTFRCSLGSNVPMLLYQHGSIPFSEVLNREEWANLNGSARDEEPLVINAVNGLGSQVLMSGYFKGARINAVRGVRDSAIGPTAVLASLYIICDTRTVIAAYSEIPPGWVLPVINFSQASAHSRMTSVAYFLFLHSPEKANWFSGFPSGIL